MEGEEGKDRECCFALDKDIALCRCLVKAAEDESESSPLTEALVVRGLVWFHLVCLPQGKSKKRVKHRKPSPSHHLDIFPSIKLPESYTVIFCPKILSHLKLCVN